MSNNETRFCNLADKSSSKYVIPDLLFNKRIWTVEDVSKCLGLAKGTIYNKVSRREIPFSKRGNRLFFDPTEIENWALEGDSQ